MADQIKQIGNYTYSERFCLGEGSFGRVYEGSSKSGKRVAIKKVDKKVIYSDQYLKESIETEIQILKKFNHPNIVKLEEVVLTANSIYIVTEFCKNGDLKSYLRQKKPNEEECVRILVQLVAGMKEIVKQGIIHRDLKPANVLVHEGVFKICDFGFAKYFKELGKMNRTCVGTPMYMSPQALKHRPYTNKSDVWSLGVVFYEMLFGRTPWQGNAEDQLFRNINSKPLSLPNCSKFSGTLLRSMLEIEETNRWSWERIFDFIDRPTQPLDTQEKPSLFYQEQQPQQGGQGGGFQFGQMRLVKQQSTERFTPNVPPGGNAPNPLAPVQPYTPQQSLSKSHSRMPSSDYGESKDNTVREEGVNRSRNPIFQQKGDVKMKPKNMLAYFEAQRTDEDARFCYFILVQLYLNPLRTPSFEIFLWRLCQHTVQLYAQLVETEKAPYKDVLALELEEVLEIEVPRFPTNKTEIRELAAMVLNETDRFNSMSTEWIRRFLERRYTYEPM